MPIASHQTTGSGMRSRPSIAWMVSSSGSRWAGQAPVVGHVSELDDFAVDAVIANDITKTDLYTGLKETLEPLGFLNRSTRKLVDRFKFWLCMSTPSFLPS